MKNIKKFFKNQKGFSLVELIIVIAILAVLAGIAVPNLIGYIQRSRTSADLSNATIIANAIVVELAYRDGNFSTGGDANSTVEFKQYTTEEANANVDRALINAAIGKLQNVPRQSTTGNPNFYIKVEGGKVSVYRGATTATEKVYPN